MGRWQGCGVVAGLVCAGVLISGCGGGASTSSGEPDEPESNSAGTSPKKKVKKKKTREYGLAATPMQYDTVPCRIFTPEPGFRVLVDGVEARTDDGKPLLTPCEVGIPEGEHTLMLAKDKHEDLLQDVLITSPREFELSPVFKPFTNAGGYSQSRFTKAKLGESIPLLNLSTGGAVFDPFLSPDGKTLYFGGDRKEGRAIYYGTRANPFDDFGEPVLIRATRGTDKPCSPSTTADGNLVIYLAADKARVWSVQREGDEFTQKRELKVGESEDEVWHSAQISADGLTLYCLREVDGKSLPSTTTRKEVDFKFKEPWAKIDLPGEHAMITSDGLRQFEFDGKILTRVSRRKPGEPWSEPETVIELDLKKFERSPTSRQFWVSDDEQWMFYCDDPEDGNLYAVRIAEGARWGFVPKGQPLDPKAKAVAATEPDPETPSGEKPEMPEKPDEPRVDPRSQPLPYTAYRETLEGLVRAWKFDEAEKAIDAALADPRHEKDRELIGWDREEVKAIREFADQAILGAKQLKPGDEIRIGLNKVKFTKLEQGVMTGETGGKEVSKPLAELSPPELTALAEKVADKGEAFQLQVAVFNAWQPKPSLATIASRVGRAGVAGRTFQSRLARRKLHLVEQEFDRENIPVGLAMIDEITRGGAKSESATEALRLKESLFTRTQWEPIGGRAWDTKTPGEFVAGAPAKSIEGAYLMSPRDYRNLYLSLEWKTAGGPASQGGVFFRYTPGQEIRKGAWKVHVANDAGGPLDKFATGSLFGKEAPKARAVKPEGQWNTLLLRVEGDKVRATVNGTDVLDTKLADPMIAPQGRVCLDGEFVGITYRKILLYELPQAGPKKQEKPEKADKPKDQ